MVISRRFALVAALLLGSVCLALAAGKKNDWAPAPAKNPEDVEGAVKNEDGQYELTYKDKQYLIVRDEKNDRVYFVDKGSNEAQWLHPEACE